ncbi:PIN domain-containing protein [Acidobacteria bacterium AH-259-D05]|nr:PIN domain-containing protein [Acidobacteria bacterium AH-259-D05]
MRSFLDSNVLVYLFDRDAPEKRRKARSILEHEGSQSEVLISTQVLQEFYVCVTRKLAKPLKPDAALQAVQNLTALSVVQVDTHMILSAAQRCQKDQMSFWDALIVQAALGGEAKRLYTEDLQHGQTIDGMRIENPFL